jgi:hypothetical protein
MLAKVLGEVFAMILVETDRMKGQQLKYIYKVANSRLVFFGIRE